MAFYLSQAGVSVAAALSSGLADGYAWHKAIWRAFPGRPEDSRDFLFRVDQRGKAFRVLLLSAEEPVSDNLLVWQTKPVEESFLAFGTYRFEIRANPTFRRSSDHRRLALFGEKELREWIARKAIVAGFVIEEGTLKVSAPQTDVFTDGDGRHGKHVSADFEGILKVADHTAFVQAFQKGIGSAKGFGYGMLMLQPIHN
jgi:CRISPR system Cascade subunit CasE